LVNTAKDQIEVKVRVTYTYVKASYVPLNGDTTIEVNVPDGKLAQGFKAMARLTIEPYAPFAIKAVERPDGTPATVYRVEPKVVEINTAGKYKIMIAQGQPLPAAMLVKSLSKQTASVAPNGEFAVTGAEVGVPQGWRLLGYVVFAYTGDANLIGKDITGDIAIQGGLVDTVTDVNQNIIVRSVSYLIPPVWNFNIRYKIAIVYGEQFKITTSLPSTVNVIYIPIVYREAQVKWLPDRALVNITDVDVADGQWTAVVMQLPELARDSGHKDAGQRHDIQRHRREAGVGRRREGRLHIARRETGLPAGADGRHQGDRHIHLHDQLEPHEDTRGGHEGQAGCTAVGHCRQV
jgi:hypothetical protein